MVFVGALLVVAILTGLAVWAFRRRGSDELHSVAGYQHRLERLEELRRRQGGSVRIVGSAGQAPRDEPVPGETGRIEISSSGSPRRSIEDAGQRPPSEQRRPPQPYRRARRDLSISRMSHRPRRLGAPIAAAAAVIILVIVLAILGARAHPPKANTTGQSHHGTGHHPKNTTTSTTTSTTLPASFTAASVSAPDATYNLPYASYTLNIQGTGSGGSWVQVTEANGSVPYAAVLGDGQTQQLTVTGDSRVELGRSADVAVTIDQKQVSFPNPLPDPLVLVLNTPQTSGTTTTTTTSPG